MSKYLSKDELDTLKLLKVVRADSNETFQKLLATYSMLILDVEDLESENQHLQIVVDDIEKDYNRTQDELIFVRGEYNKADAQNRTLTRSLSRFIKDLDQEGLITRSDTDGNPDTSI